MANILVCPTNILYLMSVTYHLHDLVSVEPLVSQYERSLNFLGANVSTCPSFCGILQILPARTNFLSRTLFSKEGVTNFYNIANNTVATA